MRKLFLGLALLFLGQFGYGQAVNDQAVIPVSVTLNSILRLTVVSGGNIDFVVNTIAQYTTGINLGGTSAQYQTNFTVSSSQDFDVNIRAEDANLVGQDNSTANTMDLSNVGYDITENGSGAVPTNFAIQSTVTALTNGALPIVTGVVGQSAGSAEQNDFTIRWRLATNEGNLAPTTALGTLLAQSLAPDRYVTNVFLELEPK